MDKELQTRLKKWHDHLEELELTERKHYELEASEKSMFAMIFNAKSGKTIAEREHLTYMDDDWAAFQQGLAYSRANYNKERRKLDLLIKAFDAAYLHLKRAP